MELPESFSLQGRVAAVTGASRGIGLAIAAALFRAGARLVICGRNREAVEEAAAGLDQGRGDVLPVAANVSRAGDRETFIERAMAWGGRIDILVNNVGANPYYGPLADLDESSWDKVFEVNLKACLFLSQLAYRAWMKDHGGVILNVSSLAGLIPTANINAYSVSKAALDHLTRCLANEWGRDNVRVNALSPGLIRTEFSRSLWESPSGRARIRTNPISRLGEAEDVARGALFLASPAAAFISGQTLILDGGEIVKGCGWEQ
ncbi:MAG: SDR family oxidoreductase [Proteobacteria bacterium]|nr:SDR family oxidoreductase [Pseudomonadota bacterium]